MGRYRPKEKESVEQSITEPFTGHKLVIVGNRSNHRELRDLIVNHGNLILVSEVDKVEVPSIDIEDAMFRKVREVFESSYYKTTEQPNKIYDSKRLKRRR